MPGPTLVPASCPRWARVGLAGVLAALVAAVPAAGQAAVTLELGLSNPGARSLGFGGAFAALADDATAAYANPAGLTQLLAPEVSVEGRSWSYRTPYVRGGRISGPPSGFGIDTATGVLQARSRADLTGLSFLSFVYPRERWSLALYRHRLADYSSTIESLGLFDAGPGPAGTVRGQAERGFVELEILSHSLAAAWQVGERLSLGLGVCHFAGRMRLRQEEYLWDADTAASSFAASSFLPERQLSTGVLTVDDQAWGLAAGVLWRLAESWRLGGFYRQGPELDVALDFRSGPVHGQFPPGSAISDRARVAFPDVYGLGAAWRSPDGRLVVSFEWDRVGYSAVWDSLSRSTRSLEDRLADFDPSDPPLLFSDERIPDGDELHLGAEVAFPQTRPLLAVRLGLWLDPDHRIRTRLDNPYDRATLPPGDDELHYALGLGVRLERLQVDLAADLSELRDTVSVSAIYFF